MRDTRMKAGGVRGAQMRAIARHEFRAGIRGRMVPAFAILFATLTIGVTLAGLGASGQILVQGFTRTAVSLLTLSVYLLPLVGLMLGASAFGGEDGGTELLLAQPISRSTALYARVAGLSLCVAGIALAGFGTAGLVVLSATGTVGFGGYAVLSFATTVLAIASLHVGVFIGVLVRRRTTAVGWALATWFAAAVLYDLASIMVLQVTGSGHPGPLLVGMLALNPLDGVRVLGTLELGADVLLGPTGAAVQRLMGGAGWLIMWGSLVLWTLLPLGAARFVYTRRDF
jgi:Cu-processing system permease protein